MSSMIQTENVALGFSSVPIVGHISLQIQAGEFIGLFGANGSGKTTFLRALLGLIKPLTGRITVMNMPPKRGNPHIGYMPQLRTHEIPIHLTGRARIAASIQCTRYGLPLPSSRLQQSVEALLELVEAQNYADRPFQALSGGERQRIHLALALQGPPSILLLDEPLAGLDPHYQDVFIKLLVSIKKKMNATILFTAHDPNPLLPVMDRIIYFANQRAAIGTVNEVINPETLSQLYGTSIDVIHYKNRIMVLGEQTGNYNHHV